MDTSVEIRYAGVVVGHATQVRDRDVEQLFVVVPDPLPVGSVVELVLEGSTLSARVESIVESADAAACGMRLRLIAGGAASARPDAVPGAVAPAADASGVVESVEDGASGMVGTDEGGDDGAGPEAPAGGQAGQSQGGGRRRRRRRR